MTGRVLTREQALAAARVVYGAGATLEDERDIHGITVWYADRSPLSGARVVSAYELDELVEGLVGEHLRLCQLAADPWFVAGGRAVAEEVVRRSGHGPRYGATAAEGGLAQLQRWLGGVRAEVYRAAGVSP